MKYLKVHSLAILLVVGLIALWGCPKNSDVTSSSETPQKKSVSTAENSPKSGAVSRRESRTEPMKETVEMSSAGLKSIYFDSGKSFIRKDAKTVMKANADWLKANPMVNIMIVGNCDQRGTKEYNNALGMRRSASAKKYLVGMGISAKRISLVSYGGDKPMCTENNKECWQKNSRADFIVVK